MNHNLEQAVSLAAALPDVEQDRIATRIQEMVDRMDDVRWQEKFAEVEGALALLHEEALRDSPTRCVKVLH